MTRSRLIFVNRIYWPDTAATAQLLTDLAERLAERGWPVHVVAAGDGDANHRGVVIHRTGGKTRHRGVGSQLQNYRRFIRHARHRLAELVQPGDVVVCLTDPPMLGARLAAIAQAKGAKVIHWIQDIYPEVVAAHVGALAALPLQPWRRQRNTAWRSAKNCVVLGADMARTVLEQGVAPERIAIVPNWAPRELEVPAAPAAIAARRRAWGLEEKFIVAYSGNLGRVHEFTAIVEAAQRLQHDPAVVFLFIGTGARLEQVRLAARSAKLENIRFIPPEPRENLSASLAAADVQLVTLKPKFAPLVYPSKLAGAMAAGRPVIFVGPPNGEIATLLAHERCGVGLASENAAGLAELVSQWNRDPEERIRVGARARVAYEKLFTFHAAVACWETLLEQQP